MFSSQQPAQVFSSFQVIKRILNPGRRHWWFQRHYTSLNLAEHIFLIPARGSEAKFRPFALCCHPHITGWVFKRKDMIWNTHVLIPSPPHPSHALSLVHSLWKSFPGWHFQRQSKKGENHQKIMLLWKGILMAEMKMQEGWWEEKFAGIDLKMGSQSGLASYYPGIWIYTNKFRSTRQWHPHITSHHISRAVIYDHHCTSVEQLYMIKNICYFSFW